MSDDETREALTDRLDEIGALRNVTHTPGDDPTTWINAPLSVVLDEVSRVLHAKRGTAPEPPHLDPYPIAGPGGEGDRWQWTPNLRTFAPRPADEQGCPYSQRREDYEEGQ